VVLRFIRVCVLFTSAFILIYFCYTSIDKITGHAEWPGTIVPHIVLSIRLIENVLTYRLKCNISEFHGGDKEECRSVLRLQVLLALSVARRFLSSWWWRRYVPRKRRFLQEPQGVASQKTAVFRNWNVQGLIFPWCSFFFCNKPFSRVSMTLNLRLCKSRLALDRHVQN
jgi:hypothetical protein